MLAKAAGQLRTAGMGGVVGIDVGAALALGHALGFDEHALAELLPAAEAGLVAGLGKQTPDASASLA